VLDDSCPAVVNPFWAADFATSPRCFDVIRSRSDGIEQHTDDRGTGLWSLTSHAAVSQVSRDPA
jgi:hypothetical protein